MPVEPSRFLNLLKRYFEMFGDKSACYEDLRPYSDLYLEVLPDWIAFLDGISHTPVSCSRCRRSDAKAYAVLR